MNDDIGNSANKLISQVRFAIGNDVTTELIAEALGALELESHDQASLARMEEFYNSNRARLNELAGSNGSRSLAGAIILGVIIGSVARELYDKYSQ